MYQAAGTGLSRNLYPASGARESRNSYPVAGNRVSRRIELAAAVTSLSSIPDENQG